MNKKNIMVLILLLIALTMCVENHVLPKFGQITIVSDPAGAVIYKNGTLTNEVTPAVFEELFKGEYSFMLKLNTFIDTTFNIQIGEDQEYTEDIFLIEKNPKGKITLTSDPIGAKIFLENKDTGKKTPATFDKLQRGNYNFTLELNLYENNDVIISLAQNEIIARNTKLVVLGSAGSIFIKSNPQGANIKLDGNPTGLITPDTLMPVAAGQHSITLSLKNYRDTTITTHVVASSTIEENVELTFYEPRGSITINSNPQGAQIFLDGLNTGLQTPNTITKVEAGSYTIKLHLEDYNDTTFTTTILEDQNNNVGVVNLIKTPVYKITTSSNPIGASSITGSGDYKTGKQVTVVTVANPGYKFINWTEENVEVSTNTNYTFTVNKDRNLIANYNKIGKLIVRSNPIGAAIFLNDINTNKKTPHTFTDILTGEYKITLKLKDFADSSKTFSVNRNQATNTGVIFLKDTTADVKISTLDYTVKDGKLVFLFTVNQDITLNTVELTRPDGTILPPTNFGGQKRLKGKIIDVSYPEKIIGKWKLRIKGNKVAGRKSAFDVGKKIEVN